MNPFHHPKLLPTVMVFLDLAASGVYLYNGDVRRGLYWLFGAAMVALVTY